MIEFSKIFGAKWKTLPPSMKRRYAVRPYGGDRVTMRGFLDIEMRGIFKWCAPLLKLIGLLIPLQGRFQTTVHFCTYHDSDATELIREVAAPNKPIIFNSYWDSHRGEVIEIMSGWICWRASYGWDGKEVQIKHIGYAAKLGRYIVPLPLNWLLGKGNAWETPLSPDSFAMKMQITHPLWGKLYSYSGEFRLEEA